MESKEWLHQSRSFERREPAELKIIFCRNLNGVHDWTVGTVCMVDVFGFLEGTSFNETNKTVICWIKFTWKLHYKCSHKFVIKVQVVQEGCIGWNGLPSNYLVIILWWKNTGFSKCMINIKLSSCKWLLTGYLLRSSKREERSLQPSSLSWCSSFGRRDLCLRTSGTPATSTCVWAKLTEHPVTTIEASCCWALQGRSWCISYWTASLITCWMMLSLRVSVASGATEGQHVFTIQ